MRGASSVGNRQCIDRGMGRDDGGAAQHRKSMKEREKERGDGVGLLARPLTLQFSVSGLVRWERGGRGGGWEQNTEANSSGAPALFRQMQPDGP